MVLSHLLIGFSLPEQEAKSIPFHTHWTCTLKQQILLSCGTPSKHSSKVHKQNLPALGNGPTNSTSIDANAPILMTPTSPIMKHHVDVSHPEGSSMTTVKDVLEDPQIQPGMIQSALSMVTSLLNPVNYLLLGITSK